LFSYNFTITATPDIKVRLQANGSTERIMIDDFTINTVNGELLFYEDFNFSGDLRDNGWVSYLGTQNQITTTTGLAYSGYEGSGIGNAAYLYGAGGEDIYRLLTPQNSDGSTLYLSFLVNVTDTDLNDGGSYSLHMADAPNFDILTDQFCCAFHMRIVDGSVNFGVRVSTLGGNEEWDPTDYSKNQTYLIIIKYVINFSANDEISLWVKSAGVPSSESNAGTPGAYSNVGAGLDELDAICFRQVPGGDILEATYDGFRISDSWDFAPLPVELSSFSAVVLENGVKLEWRTETEVNNYGFEILRSTQNDNGQKIGFVEGHGNSNSPKEYSFTDNNAQYGSFAYRLKQIDTDGDYEYSNIIEVDAGNIPNGFVLEQNFPNPFNPTTSIKFALGKTQNVELKVFDVLGNEVATLFNGLADGEKVYETEFNAENFSSGIYFYRLETKNKVENRKMMLLK
ncbi:MAG: T9SS type A sorting domain-containing protein, partial [Ignavibacteriaceae bacterium]|nr:T9SS type A sorting domain-containing protein [Ignavibacteriaceae bacterium]